MTDRRFIEESFPVKEVSAISAQEKNIRHGHISTLHTWWARRPLAASRATAYAALTEAAGDNLEWQRRQDFIIQMSRWENLLNPHILKKACQDIYKAHASRLSAELGRPVTVDDVESGRVPRPRVLDPFAGGGAIPLEALRLGCETYASDYNPVAVLLLKASMEYPQTYGQPVETEEQGDLLGGRMMQKRIVSPLLGTLEEWGGWVLAQARKELAPFYPPDPDGSVPVGYIWARTIPCQNPTCGVEIPLMGQLWLAKKERKRVALYPDGTSGRTVFLIVGDGHEPWPAGFDPDRGTVARAVATCPVCGGVVDAKTTRQLFRRGTAGQRLVAVVLLRPGRQGKIYRLANPQDEIVFRQAEAAVLARRDQLMADWGMSPIPDEPTPEAKGPGAERAFTLRNYGLFTWGSLFNPRQQLAMITFAECVRRAHREMGAAGIGPELAKAVATYLALTVDELARFTSTLNPWKVDAEAIVHVFGRQTLSVLWDYNENNPTGSHGGTWANRFSEMLAVLGGNVVLPSSAAIVGQSSAVQLPYPAAWFDAVLTDPPYYDNVPYSHLSDYFYVWLKRTVGHLYPELFSSPLSPKSNEIVAYSNREGGFEAGKRFFEDNLKRSFQEAHRVLKPGGLAIIVYAHKSTAGWETVTNALLDSGLVMTGAWPLHTEMAARLRARESAALASSIYIVARKMSRQPTGFYSQVQVELRRHLDTKLQRLWEEGVSGADFFIAAIGSAIEVFGKYEQVIDFEGNVVRADRLLADVRNFATDYAVRQILRDGFAGEVSDLTRFYVLWRWEYGEAQVPFDEARKLAQSCGLDLAREWGRGGFVRKEEEFVRVLGPPRRDLDALEDSRELIDVLHRVLLLWEKGRRSEIVQVLTLTGFGKSEAFYRVAQAISETLPNESKEKKLLDGFLAGRARVREEVDTAARQERLFE